MKQKAGNDMSKNIEEKQFLEHYDITKFERPSLAADMAIFTIAQEDMSENFRKLPKQALKILLVKRADHPFKDNWALPGGFCQPDEDVIETAFRELYEETHVKSAYLKPVGIFGEQGRDPRGWIISSTFMALVDATVTNLKPGSDAREAKWFTIKMDVSEPKKVLKNNDAKIETVYNISLVDDETGEKVTATVKERKQFKNYHESVKYEIMKCDKIAFDHAKIILYTTLYLRQCVENDLKLGFDLMPEYFTLTELQTAFELILGRELITPNFRRKIGDYVIETEQMIEGAGHRPAKLFRRNVETFYRNF